MTYNVLAFILLSTVLIGAVLAHGRGQVMSFPIRIVMVGLGLRVVGSFLRYEVMQSAYGFVGDAQNYYQSGLMWAGRLRSGDWSVLTTLFEAQGAGGGTGFISNLSGLALTFTGPSLRAEYLVFSILSFLGVFWIAKAVGSARDNATAIRYATIAWVWPSVWFWPSSVGKEAVIFFGLGLAILGFVGARGKYRLVPLSSGLLVLFLVRPHFAILVALAMGATHWIMSFNRMNARRMLEGLAIGAVAVVVLQSGADRLGIGDLDAEGVGEFLSFRSGQTLQGGGAIGSVPTGVFGIPMAIVNVWLRPFLWEAHNATALMSALEIVMLWMVAFHFRQEIFAGLRLWRRDRLVTGVVLMILAFTLALGMTFGNLGILARQRSPLLALFFIIPFAARVAAPEGPTRVAASSGPTLKASEPSAPEAEPA